MKRREKGERNKIQGKKTSDAQYNCSPPADRCPASPQAAIGRPRPAPPSLYTERDGPWYGTSLWLVQVSCPGSAPSQLLVPLLAGRAWETERALTQSKHNLAITRLFVKSVSGVYAITTAQPAALSSHRKISRFLLPTTPLRELILWD